METGSVRIEPLGLLHGDAARAAVAAGAASPLHGPGTAFTLIRTDAGVVPVAEARDAWRAELDRLAAPVSDWAGLGPGPLVMGILNVTPDSFSDGGDRFDPAVAIAVGEQMLEDGADLLDVGGESTRPGAAPVSPEVEQARVLPVITGLAWEGAVVSIDTRHAATMARALDAGARIVNDVSGLSHDPAAAALVAAWRCPVILMHMRGTPETMRSLADYDDVAPTVADELMARVSVARAAGVSDADIMLDPGFGFAKTAHQSLELLQRLPLLAALGFPLLAGLSRKATLGMITGETEPKRRGPASVAAALAAVALGARIVRVHDVKETVQALKVWRAVTG